MSGSSSLLPRRSRCSLGYWSLDYAKMPLWPHRRTIWFLTLHFLSQLSMTLTLSGHQCSHPLIKGVIFDDVQGSFQIYNSPTLSTLLSITSNCLCL